MKSPNEKNTCMYFTVNAQLQQKVFEFIKNNPTTILEPCIGRGDLVRYVQQKSAHDTTFDMFEIDEDIRLLQDIPRENVMYCDFLKSSPNKQYETIIGNPPYVRTKSGNLLFDFVHKCFTLLADNGELIFVVPSNLFKLSSARTCITNMLKYGTFTHIFYPKDNTLFKNALIDVLVFRYCKNKALINTKILYNTKEMFLIPTEGMIIFSEHPLDDNFVQIRDYFDVYVGLVSGCQTVFKNKELGNFEVLNAINKIDRYILIDKYPCTINNNPNLEHQVNEYLKKHRNTLLNRKMRKFNEKNWYEWGALRNIKVILKEEGKDCIYIYTVTRKSTVSFLGKIRAFGGGLIMLKPKYRSNLTKVVEYLNSCVFKEQFTYANRFIIGHRQISNAYIPNGVLS
jgi:adenine-specific DNA-methyltransferase